MEPIKAPDLTGLSHLDALLLTEATRLSASGDYGELEAKKRQLRDMLFAGRVDQTKVDIVRPLISAITRRQLTLRGVDPDANADPMTMNQTSVGSYRPDGSRDGYRDGSEPKESVDSMLERAKQLRTEGFNKEADRLVQNATEIRRTREYIASARNLTEQKRRSRKKNYILEQRGLHYRITGISQELDAEAAAVLDKRSSRDFDHAFPEGLHTLGEE